MMNPLFHNFFPPNVLTFMSCREMDFAYPDSQEIFSQQQRDFLKANVKINHQAIVSIRQVHGHRVLVVGENSARVKDELMQADALATNAVGVALSVRVADCVPLFVYDQKRECIALIHAGWRGTQQEIGIRALEVMENEWGTTPRDVKVALGPCIRSCCYQVGEEFEAIFPRHLLEKKGERFLDLPRVNINQLIDYGIREQNILDSGLCTYCQREYFSYRREGQSAGRMIALMMLQ